MAQEYNIRLKVYDDGSCEWSLLAKTKTGRMVHDTAFINGATSSIPMALACAQEGIASVLATRGEG